MNIAILGGGLSAASAAVFLQNKYKDINITIVEKEEKLGGLCRSFYADEICYDVGPHIIFSKDKEILDMMNSFIEGNTNKLRRSNRILYQGIFVQYPFENDLSKLPKEDLNKCVNAFVHNPYENYEAFNMLQFFLKTFGSGITNCYLRPYNEKIWKFDPSFMDVQMVDRIPKPPKEDILRSAEGETVDGYTHQLYFSYPKTGGIEEILKGFTKQFGNNINVKLNESVTGIEKINNKFNIKTDKSLINNVDHIISTIPANILTDFYNAPENIKTAGKNLMYNSIVIAIANCKIDKAGDNYAFMIADKEVIFHRLSKVDFLGENYHKKDTATYMIEITYRKNDLVDKSTDEEIKQQIAEGLKHIKFIEKSEDINFIEINRFEYAYVINDINHKENISIVKDYFEKEGIILNGRFGSFEYLNMDAVIRQSKDLIDSINWSEN